MIICGLAVLSPRTAEGPVLAPKMHTVGQPSGTTREIGASDVSMPIMAACGWRYEPQWVREMV